MRKRGKSETAQGSVAWMPPYGRALQLVLWAQTKKESEGRKKKKKNELESKRNRKMTN